MKWLIMYYPVVPHQEFMVYNISSCDPFLNDFGKSLATSALEQYVFARDRLYKNRGLPVPKVMGWNNSWFMISRKETVKQAIEEFWECFFKFLEGDDEIEEEVNNEGNG